jgi:hypothetical protein
VLDELPLSERPGVPGRLANRFELGDILPIDEDVSGLSGVTNPHGQDDNQSSGRIMDFKHKVLYDRGGDFASERSKSSA